MGARLEVRTSNRLDVLLDALAERLATAPLPPLQAETIVVPGQAMARWVTLGLTQRHGVAAALDLPFPGALLQRLRGEDDVDVFAPAVLALRLFRLLGDARLTAELGAAATYCRDDRDQQKRLQLAQRLAQCFDDYQLYRDDVLLAWERGAGPDLPHAPWQARLWQELLREVAPEGAEPARGKGQGLLFAGAPPAATASRGHRLETWRQLLAQPARARAALPPRLSVFGIATLPPAFLELLAAIAGHIEVTIYAPRPTPHFFGDVKKDRSGSAPRAGSGHALLAQWGRQSREFFDLLLDGDAEEQELEFVDPGTDTVLHALQSDVLNLRVRQRGGDAEPLQLDRSDESLRVHSAHGPMREMEILRDQILHAFAQDATLTPADVLVLVPDVQRYAPYVHAVFRPVETQLPFHVADRSPAAELPLPATFLRVCALARGRYPAPELLLLLEEPALARRFGIARGDLLALRGWVASTRIRWGLDGEQRQRDLGLPPDDANTWRQGLDRLVLGVATGAADLPVLGILPSADGTSGRALLLGRFASFLDAAHDCCRALGRPHTLSSWADAIEAGCTRLFLAEDDDERQGLAHLQAAARRLRELQDQALVREELSPAAFAAWLDDELLAQGQGRGFLTGAITFAALRPMRGLPMRLLAVCGLGDGEFPRRDRRATFDLLQHGRRPGDRSARDDDRQLFLDAVLAARDRLVLTWVGRSSKDNSECAPSPLLSELLEHLDLAFVPPPVTGAERARDWLCVQHPLQAFSARYDSSDERLFTYGRSISAPAVPATAAAGRAAEREVARDDDGREIVQLADLLAFWNHPVRWFCRNILDVRFPSDDDRDDDAEPFELHNLDRYNLVDDAVHARLGDGRDLIATGAVLLTGMLPPGPLGRLAHAELALLTHRFAERVRNERGTGRANVAVRGADYVVQGELDGLRADALVLWRAATVKQKDRLRAFIQHAVKCAAIEQGQALPPQTLLLGTDDEIPAPGCSPALPHLDLLVAGYRAGRRAPLPYLTRASAAYASAIHKGKDLPSALAAARSHYEPDPWGTKGVHDLPDPFLEFCFRDADPLGLPAFAEWARIYQPAATFFGSTDA